MTCKIYSFTYKNFVYIGYCYVYEHFNKVFNNNKTDVCIGKLGIFLKGS